MKAVSHCGGGSYGSYLEPPPMRKPQKRTVSVPFARLDDLAMVVLVPWILFTVFSCTLSMFQAIRILVWFLFAGGVVAAGLSVAWGFTGGHGAHLAIGGMSLASLACAAALSHHVSTAYMDEYHRLGLGSSYSEVSPVSNPAQYGDATVLSFTPDAVIGHADTIGYMHNGRTYCTAPILSRSQDRSGDATAVKFWAVGMDCCGTRSDFHCNDALDPSAHGAIVLADKAAGYNEAIRMQLPGHELTSEPGALFVRWLSDATDYRSNLLRQSAFVVGLSSSLYLLLAIAVGLVINSKVSRMNSAFCAL
mmetsp:Transcript_74073/g.176400  ORF Transcript_74073/g.176400 Transcript_74073/m.176400 type:complete len:306 (+) Transcript_74073:139-1056(+)